MTFEECRLLIPQYLSGQLTNTEKRAFEAQVEASAELRMELEELSLLWKEMGALPEEQPSAALRARFYRRLNAVPEKRWRLSEGGFAWWKSGLAGLVRQTGIPLVVFVLGVYVGRGELGRGARTAEVQRLDNEVQSLRQTVALSLLDRPSATSRLQGISWTGRIERPDHDVVAALLRTLKEDPNINVRLAALDALEKFNDDPAIRKTMIDSIPLQSSPLVQIALIDAVVHMHDKSAEDELRNLSGNTETNAAVRQRAQWGLQKLNFE